MIAVKVTTGRGYRSGTESVETEQACVVYIRRYKKVCQTKIEAEFTCDMGMLSVLLGFTFIVSGLGADTYEEALNLYRSTFHGDVKMQFIPRFIC